MTWYLKIPVFILICILSVSCSQKHPQGSFGYDLDFLQKHQEVITLEENGGQSQLIVLPGLQGRVATSTARGLEGNSFGWMNHELFASGEFEEHFSSFGGEERFWIGPEGGQYSVFLSRAVNSSSTIGILPKKLIPKPLK